ncbi:MULTISPECIES: hypothetical protein [Streptomyces]|jgi:hypothetical protein|uniref:Uncharacterized protein n=2 Tax=Streptomyces TaxID=1883 RepID=A0A1D8G8Z2_9ACTN|nr:MULTISPECIES: hypothetical protein [Streptomyces]AOT61883.1 hypothetical protein A4G23_04774 [Streptomyces rubrolavendulae]KAF0649943.1 hypothetical protein K701_11150 [Streptomyces fradiae ATCC 10745 = DSM 40063]OSY52866.1 hypothetical protein BG846_01476 [Streptomyces fradiae ATCC 10745 = DSM 40063]QEV14780.1 hypothetical protein CP974_25560 [Streptomyces fradiae ATCC 10745 = DSM 40063]UQS29609.1 hypothetical protein J5J01_22215 [Streptomyces fradiae]
MRKFGAGVSALAAAALLAVGFTGPAEAAGKLWRAEVQCTKWRIADSSGHGLFKATGTGKTPDAAYKAAIKNANDKMPKGYRAKHCTKKGVKK